MSCTALEFHLWSNSSYFVPLMSGIICWWSMLLAIKYYCSLLPIMSLHILHIYFTTMIICYAMLPWNSLKQCTTINHKCVLSLGIFVCTLLVTSHTASAICGLFAFLGNPYPSNSAGGWPHSSYSNNSDEYIFMVIVYGNQMLKEILWVNVDGFLTNYKTCCVHVGGLVIMLKRKFKYILVHYCSSYILTNNLCSVSIDLGTCCYASSNII